MTAKYIHKIWQKEWDGAVTVSSKLHEILSKLSDKLLSLCKKRNEDTILNRLRVDHSYLKYFFILKKKTTTTKKQQKNEEPPVCVACNTV